MPRPRPNAGLFAAILLVIVLLPAGYMGAYYAAAERVEVVMESEPGGSTRSVSCLYRFGGMPAYSFFLPAHEIDRKVRPAYWGE